MIQVTAKYGITGSITVEVSENTTIRQLRLDTRVRAGLGLPENVQALLDGQTLRDTDTVSDGDEIVFERQAAAKAV